MARSFPDETAARLAQLCTIYLREPAGYATDDVTGAPVVDFTPPLSAAEQTIFNRLQAVARARVLGITPAEWQALEADIALCKAFVGIASPTLAQNNAATKAHMRITAAMLRS